MSKKTHTKTVVGSPVDRAISVEEEKYGWGEDDCMLLSEAAFAEDWLSDEDREAWDGDGGRG